LYPTDRVNQIVSLVAERVRERLGPGSRVIWFGSWVRGEARSRSDIDLAVEADGGVSQAEYARLLAWIQEELPTLYRVDLVNMDEIGEPLRRQILTEGVVV
jgi:predicted nucleotidyltransferase